MDSKAKMWQAIAIVSLIIAVVALITPFMIPGLEGAEGPRGVQGDDGDDGQDGDDGATGAQGPQGATGSQGATGAQGPAGPGSLIEIDIASTNVPLTGTCAQLTGAEVTITVPGAGIIMTTAHVDLDIVHVMGTADYWRLVLSNAPGDCLAPEWGSDGSIASTWDSEAVAVHTSLTRGYSVPGPVTLIVYLNGYMMSGAGAGDQMDNANIVAVFYPS